jgi:HD-GYP domain-containing protein (c-di-GMP phosphodiesterase class II)
MTSTSDRIPLAQVRDLLNVGEPLPFRVLDADRRLLLNAGQVLLNESQLDGLYERGAWAERPLVEATRIARAEAAAKAAKVVPQLSLFDRWDRLLLHFDRLPRAIMRKEENGTAVSEVFSSLQGLIDRDPDVALFQCVRQEERRFALYPFRHSVRVAVLVVLTARQLGWAPSRCMSLGCAGLTMNFSILDLQATMAEQDTPPTKKQLEQIRAHPEATVAMLRAAGIDDEVWLTAVLEHHEHPGGGGYPRGHGDICPEARILRAADVYMAKISARAKRPPMTPQGATRQLFQQSAGDELAMAMIKTVGLHPPGCLVRLHSGEVAVVIRRAAVGPHPLVATLSDKNGRPTGETHRRDSSQPDFAVDGPLEVTTAFPRVLPERVYGLMSG